MSRHTGGGQNTLWESLLLLSITRLTSGWTQVPVLGGKPLCPLGHLALCVLFLRIRVSIFLVQV